MRYEGQVYRPPSEAKSLIVQVTIGCSHNKCTFCDMYKDKQFRVRPLEEIIEDLNEAKEMYGHVRRIFLADGNALCMSMEKLKALLISIGEIFPELERVSVYAAPKDVLRKSVEDLKVLKDLGVKMAYMGVESGDDAILDIVCKGVTSEEMIKAGQRVVESGIGLSTMIISGLGGKERWQAHALESARVISAINPDYLSLLTLMINRSSTFGEQVKRGEITLLTPEEVMSETKEFIENLNVTACVFRSNHASNYINLKGSLPEDKDLLLSVIDKAIGNPMLFKKDTYRSL